jgi:O-antigen ligase
MRGITGPANVMEHVPNPHAPVLHLQVSSGHRLGGKLISWAFGFAPVVMFLLTLDVHSSIPARLIKIYAWPVVAVELAVIVIAFVEGARVKQPRLVVALLLAFAVLAWWTAATAANPVISLLRTGLWTVHLLFGWAIFQLRFIDAEGAAHGFLAGFATLAILLAAYVGQLVPPAGYDWIDGLPGFGNVRPFGYYAAAAAAMCFGLVALTRRRWWLWGGVSAIAFAMTFWTASRGPFWALIGGLSVMAANFPAARSLRAAGLTIGAALMGFALATALPSIPGEPLSRFGMLHGNGRVEIWAAAVEAISVRPWFGYGDGHVFHAHWAGRDGRVVHAHNLVLQVLLAWGFVGAALLALLGFMLGRVVVRQGKSDPSLMPVLAAAIVLAANSLVDGTLYHIHPTSIFAMGIGLAAGRRA